jgi:hypothetical protein
MQSTGQTSTHAVSLVSMHGSQMIYATVFIILGAITSGEAAPSPAYRCDPELTRLFTPPKPLMGLYEVCTTDEPIDGRLLEGLRHGDIEALEALDAFGAAGSYKRSALARLYGGKRVSVVRGWSASADRVESITFLSPYPDASLARLMPGTMAIRFTVGR